ncbi:hypothetical protein KFK09_020539 [Dendrobium nobile]|uniref:Uncharacterized protein n=1 Tax=Dendrobium nobile TaxID=94219 RepID=A0A8T3AL83_DENNO|nr:hypothetical protein KFK09_020539 [Dendrobium nobile]
MGVTNLFMYAPSSQELQKVPSPLISQMHLASNAKREQGVRNSCIYMFKLIYK